MAAGGGTVAEYVVNQLGAWGVRRVFGLPGSSIFGLINAIRKNADIKFCVCRHGETAAFMASAHAKLTGEMGVCLADGGPGTVHLLNGIYDAWHDHVPLLALTGQVAEKWIGTEHTQGMDMSALFGHMTGFTATITSPEQAPKLLEAAVKKAYCSGVPVHLALAEDVQSKPANAVVNTRTVVPGGLPRLDVDGLDRAAALLGAAKRPAILIGRPTRGHGDEVLKLAGLLGAAVLNSLPAKGAVPEVDGPDVGCIGSAGNVAAGEIMRQADAVLILGSTWWPEGTVPKNARVVQVELEPERLGAGQPVEVGIVGDVRDVLPELTKRLEGDGQRPDREAWRDKVAAAVKRRDQWIADASRPDGVPVHPAFLIRAIEETVAPDAILAIDTGDHTLWFGAHFRATHQEVLVSGMWRAMGYGLPAAMAAKLARPGRQVLGLVGDGGLGMVLADLATAVKYDLAVTIVVSDNGAHALEAHEQAKDKYPSFGQEFVNPDFAALAESMGAVGRKVEKPEDLPRFLAEALRADRPVLVDVPTRRVPPPVVARALATGAGGGGGRG